jgi:hypothetical protein
LRYGRFWLGDGRADDGRPVLTTGSMGAMQVARVPSWPTIGLAWNVNSDTISHAGATYGQQSFLTVSAGRRLVVSILTNAARGADLIADAMDWFYGHRFAFHRQTPRAYGFPADVLQEYAGRYVGGLNDLEIAPDGDGLRVRVISKGGFPTAGSPPAPPLPPIRVGLASPERIVGLEPPNDRINAQVLRVGGRIASVRWNRRLYRREDFTPDPRPTRAAPPSAEPTNVAGQSDTAGIPTGPSLSH